jgi:hypothetical protein
LRLSGRPGERNSPTLAAPSLALVVEGHVNRETLKGLCGGRPRPPPGVQLYRRGDRRLDRHAALTIRDDLIAAPGDLHELTVVTACRVGTGIFL